ncbi:hypothetical protein [Flavobacterium sp.]|jgi:hypothetical protein|uniref:hypothetical protein n=1 Tax=Flavobacterium sp. TaxID=239 RepID=UPI0038FBFC74
MKGNFNYTNSLSVFLESYKNESRREYPSYSFLYSYSEKLLELIDKWRLENPEIDKTILLKRNVQDFKSDLFGNLKHDYEKRLKRYYQKWSFEKNKIDSFKSQFLNIVKENEK